MSLVPRGPVYTSEEDAILMAHRSTQDVIEALRAAGYEREADSIRARKKLLRSKVDVGSLSDERMQLVYDYRSLRRQRAALEARLIEVSIALMAAARMEPVEELDVEERNKIVVRVQELLRAEDLKDDKAP